MSKFDQEYYVMSMDGADNYPILSWGNTDFTPFLKESPVDLNQYKIPLEIVFGEPYPTEYEMPDLLMLDSTFACSSKLKEIFEQVKIDGVQFIPITIRSNKGEIINGYFAMYIWNKIPAVDKRNYQGSPINALGRIRNLDRFSLDEESIKSIDIGERKIFSLFEKSIIVLVYKSLFEILMKENLSGISFYRVDEWDNNTIFR